MLGGQEIIIVVVILAVLFGAKRLPEMGKSVGEGLKEFKKATRALTEDDEEDKSKKESPA